jgi:multiple sugar transport system permease protein
MTKALRFCSRHSVLTYILLTLGAFVMVFPFLWMLFTSFKTMPESVQIPPTILPNEWVTENYTNVTSILPFGNLYLNTLLMILFRAVCAILFSSMAAFSLTKLKWKGKGVIMALIVTQLMLPSNIFIIPQYQMVARLGMLDTVFALVFPGLVSAFGVFFMRQAYMGIPNSLIEAAKIDGSGIWKIFFRIVMPLTMPSMAALAVFTAVFAYGDLMWPLIVGTNANSMTLSAGLSSLRGQFTTNFPVLMAGSLLAMIPMLVLYSFFQRQFIEGIAMTGSKE